MKFTRFANFLDQLEGTSGRNQMTEMLAEFLLELDLEEMSEALYLMSGRLTPRYVDVEFNLSRELAIKAVQELYPTADVKAIYKELGDVGAAAEQLRNQDIPFTEDNQSSDPAGLNILQVYKLLYSITEISGTGSQEGKLTVLKQLLIQLDAVSSRYALRVVIGNLRLGLSEKTILDSLSWSITGDKSLRTDIERAFGAHSDIGHIAELVLGGDHQLESIQAKLADVKLTPGVPVAAKLVEREKTPESTFKRMGPSIVQPKLDGLRAQIHFDRKNNVAEVYSRNMESLTNMFPDLLSAVADMDVDSIILDSEAIGYDHENDTYLPFQETMQRRRKHGIDEITESIPVKSMTFDLLYLNGEDWSQKPLQDRLEKLKQLVETTDKKVIDILDSPLLETEEDLSEYFIDKISQGLEGLIVKKLDTTYDPGTRNFDWIKLKANTRSDMVDTVDTVVIGYYKGRGVRAKFGIGTLLVAVYDAEREQFNSVAKVGTGMKDDDWVKIKQDLDEITIAKQPENVSVEKPLLPDVWVEPKIVMEVDADEITRSPSHTAARQLPAKFESETKGRGLSLRFPRMKVWKRDKRADQATTETELVRMYELRKNV